MPSFDFDSITLGYDVAGPEGAPPIVLLHGLSGARSTWHDLTADLATDHRVYAVDQRGHGSSSKVPGTYDILRYAADQVAFLEGVVREPVVLVGHSLGGVVAAEVAGTRPDLVRGAFLEDPPMFVATTPGEFSDSPYAFIFQIMRDNFREMQARNAPLEEYAAGAGAMPALNGAGTMADVLGPEGVLRNALASKDFDPEAMTAAMDGALETHDPYRPLEVPVVVLRAEPALAAAFRPQDEAPFLAANPQGTVELVPGASHLIHEEQPALFRDRLRTFLASLP
jgi:pimeloyl-ACP methyl ester carboxylesterase